MQWYVLSLSEAREQLPALLRRFKAGERAPVAIGSHRKATAVLLPIEVYQAIVRKHPGDLETAMVAGVAAGVADADPTSPADRLRAAVADVQMRCERGEITRSEADVLMFDLYGEAARSERE